jgi:hypothetical protein
MSGQRPAASDHGRTGKPGELCTCGRPAIVVWETELFGEVGYCGIPGMTPISPCPFCGASQPHREKCPQYRLTPER